MKTDAQLQQDVIAELKWEPSINATQIGVEVRDGVVTLAGHVASFAEKWETERAAQRVAGVVALAVEIEVALPGSSKRSDADIARSAENVLQWMTYLPKDSVKVMVEGGWITLSGAVNWEYQRQAASGGVRYLMGVKGVSDHIGLTSASSAVPASATAGKVKADIEAALKRRAARDGQAISVEVRGADVTLSGTVHSWSERELARHSAWGAPGVRNVTDNLVVVAT